MKILSKQSFTIKQSKWQIVPGTTLKLTAKQAAQATITVYPSKYYDGYYVLIAIKDQGVTYPLDAVLWDKVKKGDTLDPETFRVYKKQNVETGEEIEVGGIVKKK